MIAQMVGAGALVICCWAIRGIGYDGAVSASAR
jgi:hypothetical protein